MKKGTLLVVLMMLFASCLPLLLPQASGRYYQNIYDLRAPELVNAGDSGGFTITIRVQADFTGEGDVDVWARLRSLEPAYYYYYEWKPVEQSRTVRGELNMTWSFYLATPRAPMRWELEAYVFHWEGATLPRREVIDASKRFTVTVVEVKIASITPATEPFTVGVVGHVIVSISYSNLDRLVLYASASIEHRPRPFGQPSGPYEQVTVASPPLSGSGSYIFVPLVVMPEIPGNCSLGVGVSGHGISVGGHIIVKVFEPIGFHFSISVRPNIVSLKPGESGSCQVDVGLVEAWGRVQKVSLTYTIAPLAGTGPAIGASLSPTKGTPPFTSNLTITTTAQTAPGTYTITVRAVGDGTPRQALVALTVVGPSARVSTDWAVDDLWLVPWNPGESEQVTFYGKVSALSSDKPFPQQVSVVVYVNGVPICGDAVLVPRERVAVTVTASTRWTAWSGTPTVAFVADPANTYEDPDRGNNRRELSLQIHGTMVRSAADFSVSVKPELQSLRPGGSAVYDIYVDLKGGPDTVALTVSGLPPDATYVFDPPTGLPPFQSKLTIYVPAYTAAGATIPTAKYLLIVTGQAGGLIHSTPLTVVVQAAEAATTQRTQTTTQPTLTSTPVAGTTTQVTEMGQGLAGALSGREILLVLFIVAVAACVAYYLRERRKGKPEPKAML